ncbi:MAG: ThuA domain-containing protein [Herbaspirillum sp.]
MNTWRVAAAESTRQFFEDRNIMQKNKLSVIVWNEYEHERENPDIRAIYPDGLHAVIARALAQTPALDPRALPLEIGTATLDQPEHGLGDARLAACDVLIWWGHKAHAKVSDDIVDRVQRRVLEGMGLIVLHSGHFSKIFRRLLGTHCSLKWREAAEKERLWVVEPSHPIAAGLGAYFELQHEEMYGERFDIPQPDTTVFISWFEGGEVFRSGCCWERGHGRIFYFRPGHEAYPTYHDSQVQRVIANAVQWAAPRVNIVDCCPMSPPLEKLSEKSGQFAHVGIQQSQGDIT